LVRTSYFLSRPAPAGNQHGYLGCLPSYPSILPVASFLSVRWRSEKHSLPLASEVRESARTEEALAIACNLATLAYKMRRLFPTPHRKPWKFLRHILPVGDSGHEGSSILAGARAKVTHPLRRLLISLLRPHAREDTSALRLAGHGL